MIDINSLHQAASTPVYALAQQKYSHQEILKTLSGGRLQVQGHRGGFQPENTLKAFRQAIEHRVEGIELDVWQTLDGVLVVLHGGNAGELNHHFHDLPETVYIFERTYAQLLEYEMGEGERVPKLEEVFELTKRSSIHINIEVKAPHDEETRNLYDFKGCIEKVHELVGRYGIEGSCYVSSFDHGILEELESLNKKHGTKVEQVYLYNYFDTDELPAPEVYAMRGRGINISSTKLTKEVVEICHANNKLVGVWIDRDVASEGEEFYQLLYRMGVDFFCSDYPQKVYESMDLHYDIRPLEFGGLGASAHTDESRLRIMSQNFVQELFISLPLPSMMPAEFTSKDLSRALEDQGSESTLFSEGGQANSNFNSENYEAQLAEQSSPKFFEQPHGGAHADIPSMMASM